MKRFVLWMSVVAFLFIATGCSSLIMLKYPEGKTVTMAPWSGSQNTKPTGAVLYSKTKFGGASFDDITKAIDECISKTEGTTINDLSFHVYRSWFFGLFSTIKISGEVSK